MIIQCEQCQAKFRLDDSKVTEKGVKVRCAKCKNLFTVTKEQPEAEPFEQAPVNLQREETVFAPTPQQPEAQQPITDFSFETDFAEEVSPDTPSMESNPFETLVSASDNATEHLENSEFSLSSLEENKVADAEMNQVQATPGEFDFGSFDFGDSSADTDKSVSEPPAPAVSENVEAAMSLEFSDDDMFGTILPPRTEELADPGAFDFSAESFADSMAVDGAEAGHKEISASLDSVDAPFSLGEIEFGDEPASTSFPQVSPDELKPTQEIRSATLVVPQDKPALAAAFDNTKNLAPEAVSQQSEQNDLPPLSIASRRKQSPVFTGLIAVVALLVVGTLGYFGFTSFSEDKGKVVQETGKISVRSVKAVYVKNASAGLLLAISGEAVNEYAKPRAALQVKGMIFDAKGQILANKSAFGGNQLSDEQLASLTLDKIEAAMANQFGDSLSNMEVAPGKMVPFMIVIANPPAGGIDFGVEPTGSTVATGKQQ